MAMVVVDASCLKQADSCSPSHMAWSEGRQPLVRCAAFIKWTEWTLAMTFSGHDDSTINIVLGLLLLLLLLLSVFKLKISTMSDRLSSHLNFAIMCGIRKPMRWGYKTEKKVWWSVSIQYQLWQTDRHVAVSKTALEEHRLGKNHMHSSAWVFWRRSPRHN